MPSREGGVIAAAALVTGRIPVDVGEAAVAVVSAGNMDLRTLGELI